MLAATVPGSGAGFSGGFSGDFSSSIYFSTCGMGTFSQRKVDDEFLAAIGE